MAHCIDRWFAQARFFHTATFSFDDLLIGAVDLTTVTLGGGNILFTHFDVNSTSSTDPDKRALQFGLIDHVVVRRINPPNVNGIRKLRTGPVHLVGTGIPAALYDVDASTDLRGTNWIHTTCG